MQMPATELWKPVVGYEGRYEVSDQGRVRSLDRIVQYVDGRTRPAKGVVLKQTPNLHGRLCVSLGFGTANKRAVHITVAEAFLGPRPPGLQVCHTYGDKTDNRAENLRYDTPSGNRRDDIRNGVDHNANKTHCPHEHEYTPDNTYHRITRAGFNQRTCRTCKREQKRQARAV